MAFGFRNRLRGTTMSPEVVTPKKATTRQLAIFGFVAGVITVAIIAFIYM